MKLTKSQSKIAAVGVLVLFFVGSGLLLNNPSRERPAPAAGELEDDTSTTMETAADPVDVVPEEEDPGDTSPATLMLEEFHRSETKDGKIVWEIKGNNARIYPENNSVKINDSYLVFNSDSGDPIEISSSKALVFLESGKLSEAHTSGGVKVVHNKKVTITTDSAVYSAGENSIHAEGKVFIESDLIDTTGTGLEADVEKQEVFLKKNVESVIKPKPKTQTAKRK